MTGLKQRLSRRSASGDATDGKSRMPGFLRRRTNAQRPAWGKRARQAEPGSDGGEPGSDGGTATQGALPKIKSKLADLGRLGERLPWGKDALRQPADAAGAPASEVVEASGSSSFRDRGRLRRRLQFLRRARELAFRDVGGLIFDMRRFERDRPDLLEAKLSALRAVDAELRALERVLDDRRPIHELREPGLSSCPRCGALHASEDRFCPHCGLQFGGSVAMGEVGGAIAAPPQAPAMPGEAVPAPAPVEPGPSQPAAQTVEGQRTPDPAAAPTEVNRPTDGS